MDATYVIQTVDHQSRWNIITWFDIIMVFLLGPIFLMLVLTQKDTSFS